jgi:hypothetical protein
MAALDELDEVVEQYHLALGEFMKGNPEPAKKLFSHQEDSPANWHKKRADERTRTADLTSLGVSRSTVERRARAFPLSSRQLYLPGALLV